MLRCEICHKGPKDGVSVFRQNTKGEKGVWRCRVHTDAPIDETVDDITRTIEEDNEDPNCSIGENH